MLDSVILRFSDYEFPAGSGSSSIAEHETLIADAGSVWAGWWKKRREYMPAKELSELRQQAVPHRVGLLNRADRAFYSAICDQVVFDPHGHRMRSPDPALTPAYYRASSNPAWFRFTAITRIDELDFRRRFGDVPLADASFFWVINRGGKLEVHPQLPPGATVRTRSSAILHLSDLHFGDSHGFPRGRSAKGIERPSMVDRIIEATHLSQIDIGIVIVSGDIVTFGQADAFYREAIPQLQELLDRLQLAHEHMVLVPGNHDIWLDEGQEHPTWESAHEDPYRSFLNTFFRAEIQEIESHTKYEADDGWRLSVIGLNSARLRDKSARDYEYGYVGHRAPDWLQGFAEENGDRSTSQLAAAKCLNLAVLHHHILPVEPVYEPRLDRPLSVMLDAGKLMAHFRNARVHAVLHGHQHMPFAAIAGRAAIASGKWRGQSEHFTVLGGGSAGVKLALVPDFEVVANTASIYVPCTGGLQVRTYQYTPSAAASLMAEGTFAW